MRAISRSKGNTVNALAYFSGTNLYDDKTGQWLYHSHKNVSHVELLLPKDAPEWARELQKGISSDRQLGIRKFSNLAEAAEKRKDSCVYREFEFALPKELTNVQNIALAREFLQDQVCGRGIAVVANFHFEEDKQTGEARPHCHALFTTRRLEEKGFSEHKELMWKNKAFLLTLREQLAL
jgi:ATP-dependent exoDNAse (exonuclease V) alpha subunit